MGKAAPGRRHCLVPFQGAICATTPQIGEPPVPELIEVLLATKASAAAKPDEESGAMGSLSRPMGQAHV